MTGLDHYRTAEKLVRQIADPASAALVHALLANAAPAYGLHLPPRSPVAANEALHKFDWREDTMGNYSYRCCDKGMLDPVHDVQLASQTP